VHAVAVLLLALVGLAVILLLLDGRLTAKLRRPPKDSPFNDTAAGKSLFENGGGQD
jgi:hypothetical protein